MNVIIPRNSTIPVKAGEMFTTAVNQQRAMKIKVLQGEREMAADNWPLGEFELEFPPAPKGVARVGVQFEIDADGILQVLARDTKTGIEKIVALTSAVDVSDEAVEAMLAESLEHAFEDMSERVWTETRLKSEEMLAAVEKALPARRRPPACWAEGTDHRPNECGPRSDRDPRNPAPESGQRRPRRRHPGVGRAHRRAGDGKIVERAPPARPALPTGSPHRARL